MNAVKQAAKYISRNPDLEEATILRDLCAALENDKTFKLNRIYNMRSKAYNIAIKLLDEWQFDRHVSSRRLGLYLADAANEEDGD